MVIHEYLEERFPTPAVAQREPVAGCSPTSDVQPRHGRG